MNDESQFRISSTLLTVACIVCGISAVVFVVPKYIQRNKSVNHSTAAGELQLNLAEFHAAQPNNAPEPDQPQAPTRRKLLPVSSAIPQRKEIGIDIAGDTESETHRVGAVGSVRTASSNFIESTVVDRHADQWTSRGDSVPQFYAPVTVHPVTVNIDNTGIIREISRVNDRLDSLASEKSQFEKQVFARIEDGLSASAKTATAAKPVDGYRPAARTDEVVPNQSHPNNGAEPTSTDVCNETHTTPSSAKVRLPAETSRSSTSQRLVERLRIAEPPVEVLHEIAPAPRLEPASDQDSVPAPVVETPVEFNAETPFEPEPVEPTPMPPTPVDSKPAGEFDAGPKTAVPEVPSFELPSAESDTIEFQTGTEFEFSQELMPDPSPVPVTPETASANAFVPDPAKVNEPFTNFEPVVAAEPVRISEPVDLAKRVDVAEPLLQPWSVSEMAQVKETTDVPTATPQTAELPALPDLTSPGLQWAKRTTDPPFMNGTFGRRANPAVAIGNKAHSKVQQVSHSVEATKKPVKPSQSTCQNCAKAKEKSSPGTKAVSPPSPIQRLRSLFK